MAFKSYVFFSVQLQKQASSVVCAGSVRVEGVVVASTSLKTILMCAYVHKPVFWPFLFFYFLRPEGEQWKFD